MVVRVVRDPEGHRLAGDSPAVATVNRYLSHLGIRSYSLATVRAYAFDLANFVGFLVERQLSLEGVRPSDLFDYLDWQARRDPPPDVKIVRIDRARRIAPATMNRRISAVRGLFEYCVTVELRADNPVPAARRSSGLRATRPGLLGHLGAGRPRGGGQLVRESRRLTESLDMHDVTAFLADLGMHRDRDRARHGARWAALGRGPGALALRRRYGAGAPSGPGQGG